MYSNLHAECLENHIILSGVSDHYGTLSKIEGISKQIEKQDVYYRKTKLSDHKWEELKLDFKDRIKNDIPFPHLLNANSLANSVTDTCQASIFKFMPEVKESKAQKSKPDRPWINLELKTKISHMYELLRISKETRLPQDYQNYKIYLNKLTMEKTKARNEYYRKNQNCMAGTNQRHGN